MSWSNVKLIYFRELRDQLRDRRTLFTIVVLPLLLYPLMGMSVFQVQQFLKEHASKVRLVGTDALPKEPPLLEGGKVARDFASERLAGLLKLDVVPRTRKTLEELREQAQRDIQLGLCDRLAILHRGHILAEGTLGELRDKYHEQDLEELFFRLISEHEEQFASSSKVQVSSSQNLLPQR